MKSDSLKGVVGKNFFLSLVTLGFLIINVTPSHGSDSFSDAKEEFLQIEMPNIPNLKNPNVYLYNPEEVMNMKLVLKLGSRQVHVYQQNQLVASFPVAIGKKGWETPTGEFEIIQMIENPSWQNPWTGKVTPPSPNGPLGERWIGFWTDGKNFIGFHGTPGEQLIGQAVSHGCVRMKNKDIKELFKLVSLGIPVTVVNN
jgi:L,D-transpeptidase ErfK/SrfK